MKLKKIMVVIIMLMFMPVALAKGDITGIEKNKYEINDNSSNRVEIENVNDNKGYVEGSKFQIQDENGIVLFDFTTSNDAFVVDGLEEGNYYLVQTSVSSTYVLNPKKMSFKVKDDVVKLKFVNSRNQAPKVNFSSTITLLEFMGALDIAILIGVIIYVKNNKSKK